MHRQIGLKEKGSSINYVTIKGGRKDKDLKKCDKGMGRV